MSSPARSVEEFNLCIPISGSEYIWASLEVPADATGLIVFAHGSGSSRHSPRNRFVARVLARERLGSLLVDLLSPGEAVRDEQTAELRFDIPLLTRRLVIATRWARANKDLAGLPFGYFGASTGAAAALIAAAEIPEEVRAIVSRGGRPDLAGGALGKVRTPTLLIVGGNDSVVIDLNRKAMREMHCEREMVLV